MKLTDYYKILIASLFFVSCSDMHDLQYHGYFNPKIEPVIEQKVDVSLIWQPDWQKDWKVEWDTDARGELGYTQPKIFLMYFFNDGNSVPEGERIVNDSQKMAMDYGVYNLLFHNYDSNIDNITHANDWSSVTAVTSPNGEASLPDSLNANGAMMLMPEEIFSVYAQNVVISDDINDYVYLPAEDIYVLRMEEQLLPRTFIYLLQVELKNNKGRVTGCGSMTVDGLASSVDLLTGRNSDTPVTHSTGALFQEKITEEGDTLASYIAGRMTTYGLCGISPWAENNEFGRSVRSDIRNTCYIPLRFKGGAMQYAVVDITDKMHEHITGGVINVTIDIDKNLPTQIPITGGGGEGGVGVTDRFEDEVTIPVGD